MVGLVAVLALCFFVSLLAAGVGALLADRSASSNFSTYARGVGVMVRRFVEPAGNITEADLAHLPTLLRVYLTRAGVVGRPRVHNVRIKFHGAIRSGGTSSWMSFSGEQHSAFDEPQRLFYMRATKMGVPIDGLHAYRPDQASMRIRLASLKTLVDVRRSPTLDQSETVTFFNDMCLFAPATLVDAPVTWEPIDDTSVRGRFVLGRHRVAATLHFDANGDLVNFKSEDRYQDAGNADRLLGWSTPVDRYQTFRDGVRLPAYASGWWHPSDGAYAYLRLEVDDLAYNVTPVRDATTIPGWGRIKDDL
jgi:hypothetical protein